MMITMVVGDPHIEQNSSLHRFKILGSMIADYQPDNIIIMGDYLSLDSLSGWDKNKRLNLERKRFRKELDAGREAMELIMQPIISFNDRQKRKKKGQYKPNLVILAGNHEDRLDRYYQEDPTMKDIVDMYEEIGAHEYGWKVVGYRDYYRVGGVMFTHVPMNGVNKPISGNRVVDVALQTHQNSIVFGHTHQLRFGTDVRHGYPDHQVIYGLNCGWFGEEIPDYAKGSLGSKGWWSGIVLLNHLDCDGKFDFMTKSFKEMCDEYS